MVHCTIYACIDIDRQSNTRLPSCRKSEHLTPSVMTGYYVITLRSEFGQTIEVGYSPSLLLLWALVIIKRKEMKAIENWIYLCLCLYKHTCPFIYGFLYSWATNIFMLTRFNLWFLNILVVNNRWLQVAVIVFVFSCINFT